MTDRTGVLDAAQIRRRFPDEHYTAMHAPRYVFALRLIGSLDLPEMPRVLDVGASRFTTLLHEQLGVPIDTLGLESLHFSHGLAEQAEGRHYQFDLNDAQHQDRWLRGVEPYDLVTMAEVIEHVHTSPRLVLSFVRTLVRPGGTLILQTPNAAALGKRIRLLLGRNPYDHIDEDITNPKHFREDTPAELRAYVEGAGLEFVSCALGSYMDPRYAKGKNQTVGAVQDFVFRALPRSLRIGQTVVARRPVIGTG